MSPTSQAIPTMMCPGLPFGWFPLNEALTSPVAPGSPNLVENSSLTNSSSEPGIGFPPTACHEKSPSSQLPVGLLTLIP